MIGHELREFVDRVMDRRAIDEDDVRQLQRDILSEGVISRDVVDVLVALDRAVPTACEAFTDYLVAFVVDYAVWENRPTGVIDRDKAHWLATTLSAGDGPSAAAQRIAFEIVREAQRCDELLIGFAMRRGAAKSFSAGVERLCLAS